MPTGYTAAVADGKIATLEAFALRCARGMGALIMMRDDPMDAPLPERFEPSSWNADRLAEAKAERARLIAMSNAEAVQEAQRERAEIQAKNVQYATEMVEQEARYKAMIDKVAAWKSAPEGLKEFMLQQLGESIRFDCGHGPYQAELPSEDGAAWCAEKLAKAEKDIAYHTAEHAKEVERTEARNAWISQLRASLAAAPEEVSRG